ncbi:hypothetical protein MTR67_002064 [Solanum verrucosum]|uniref:Tf2-1-like SH3-like domain-containing protein n=1 Tax=Solanum verrucosum TaxID=315347 RepID=A0AAF0T8E5_SOLVR|nr:hypothetical protein MTR67_002064 [Solanum verrucosum]
MSTTFHPQIDAEMDSLDTNFFRDAMEQGKLSPRFIGPFEILSRVGDESRVLSLDSVELDLKLSFEEVPITILDRQVRKLSNKEIASMKVSGSIVQLVRRLRR